MLIFDILLMIGVDLLLFAYLLLIIQLLGFDTFEEERLIDWALARQQPSAHEESLRKLLKISMKQTRPKIMCMF